MSDDLKIPRVCQEAIATLHGDASANPTMVLTVAVVAQPRFTSKDQFHGTNGIKGEGWADGDMGLRVSFFIDKPYFDQDFGASEGEYMYEESHIVLAGTVAKLCLERIEDNPEAVARLQMVLNDMLNDRLKPHFREDFHSADED